MGLTEAARPADYLTYRYSRRCSRRQFDLIESAKPQRQRRQDHYVKKRRREQSPQDDHGHRPSISFPSSPLRIAKGDRPSPVTNAAIKTGADCSDASESQAYRQGQTG